MSSATPQPNIEDELSADPTAPNADTAPPPQDPSIAGYAASDRATSTDTLGFKPYVEAIASFLTAPDTEPPITISIEGEWGSGKSSFLLQLEAAIKEISKTAATTAAKNDPRTLNPPQPPPLTLRFNAWRHDKQDQLWAAFALAFVESLRKEIGWPRAFLGDIRLFCRRLHGFRAWAELCLLAVSSLIAALVLWRYHTYLTTTEHLNHARDLLDPKKSPVNGDFLSRLASHGLWGAIASLALAGFYRFDKAFRLPLSLNLKKYLAKPDYEGHTAFIETFHKDLQRLVHCYAGRSRVFVFIDDLDRCDVPKAAELMQALNLMIGDSKNLVFVLGMDREKVAAGIALKYKDLFPFLRESALWKPNVDKNDFTPLYFGYGYLEKFIQLSFTLPTPNTEVALNQFLTPRPLMTRVADRLLERRNQSFKMRLFKLTGFGNRNTHVEHTFVSTGASALGHSTVSINGQEVAALDGTPPPPDFEPAPPPVPLAVAYHRVNVMEDDERTRAIVRMTAPLFEYNPRRIKQFTNTFRLALFLFSDLGLFDALASTSPSATGDPSPPTPEQVGKIIALLLRFPDLRFIIDQDPGIIEALETEAVGTRFGPPPRRKDGTLPSYIEGLNRWLGQTGATDVLTFNVDPKLPLHLRSRYSLKAFPLDRLFTILPRAARPPVFESAAAAPVAAGDLGDPSVVVAAPAPPQTSGPVPDTPIPDLTRLAREYEELRSSRPPSPERTNLLEKLYAQIVSIWEDNYRLAVATTDTSSIAPFDSDGERIVFLALAQATVRPAHTERLLRMVTARYRSRFEHYCCLRVLQRYVIDFSADQLQRLLQALDVQWDDIAKDPPRLFISNILRSDTLRLQKIQLQTTAPDSPPVQSASAPSKPSPTPAAPRPPQPRPPAKSAAKVVDTKRTYK